MLVLFSTALFVVTVENAFHVVPVLSDITSPTSVLCHVAQVFAKIDVVKLFLFEMKQEFVKDDRGGRILTYRGFRHRQKRITGAEMEWRYWRRETCVAGLRSNVFAVDNAQSENLELLMFTITPIRQHCNKTEEIVTIFYGQITYFLLGKWFHAIR